MGSSKSVQEGIQQKNDDSWVKAVVGSVALTSVFSSVMNQIPTKTALISHNSISF